MEVKITYSRKEIEDLCRLDAETKFGNAPPLKEWSAVQSFSSVTVELIDVVLRPEPPPTGGPLLKTEDEGPF